MKIDSKTVTTHTGTFTAEEMKAVALSFARKQISASDADVVSSTATVTSDGSVTVEIVVSAPAPVAPTVEAPAAAVEPVSAEAPAVAAVPHFAPGFGASLKS